MRRLKHRQRSFADLELEQQGVRLEPALAAISTLLDRQSRKLLKAVAQDLRRGLKQASQGRDGMSAEQVLRALVLKQIKNWSFRELRERIADGLTLREFTRFGAAPVPQHKAFHRASARLTPCLCHCAGPQRGGGRVGHRARGGGRPPGAHGHHRQ